MYVYISIHTYIYIYTNFVGIDNKQSKFSLLTKMVVHALGAKGDRSPLIKLDLHKFSTMFYTTTEGQFSVECSTRLYVFFFFISVFLFFTN